MKALAILGASGHGKVVADCAGLCGWEQVVFFDDAWPQLQQNGHWPVLGNTNALLDALAQYDGVLVAIGNNRIRQQKLALLRESGAALISLIHPAATVSAFSSVGLGSVVFAGAMINVDARIGEGAIINTCASVDHDCVLGDAVHVSPGAHLAGAVSVGDRSWVGIGAVIRQLITVGEDVTVGAGAVVVKNIEAGRTVFGVPAV
jgi:sugar O-acyltransferase (sialic acid O-acetyltransferase NeuD family)